MSFVLACQLGHRLAAVASVAGSLYDPAEFWEPIKPMPVLQIHGTAEDKYAPYGGRGSMWSVQKTLNYWIERNQITALPDTFSIPNININDNCTVDKISWLDGLDESQVVHYKVIDGGHSWPGSKTTFSTEGNKNLDISANTEILSFFKKFNNPLTNIAYGKSMKITSTYIPSSGDTLFINAQTTNPESHTATVFAIIYNDSSALQDSIQ